MLAKWIHHMALLFDETRNTLFSLLVPSEERKILKSSGMAVQTTGDIEFLNARCRRCVPKCLFSYRRFGMAHLDWDWLGWGIMEEGSTSSSSHLCEWPVSFPQCFLSAPIANEKELIWRDYFKIKFLTITYVYFPLKQMLAGFLCMCVPSC